MEWTDKKANKRIKKGNKVKEDEKERMKTREIKVLIKKGKMVKTG